MNDVYWKAEVLQTREVLIEDTLDFQALHEAITKFNNRIDQETVEKGLMAGSIRHPVMILYQEVREGKKPVHYLWQRWALYHAYDFYFEANPWMIVNNEIDPESLETLMTDFLRELEQRAQKAAKADPKYPDIPQPTPLSQFYWMLYFHLSDMNNHFRVRAMSLKHETPDDEDEVYEELRRVDFDEEDDEDDVDVQDDEGLVIDFNAPPRNPADVNVELQNLLAHMQAMNLINRRE